MWKNYHAYLKIEGGVPIPRSRAVSASLISRSGMSGAPDLMEPRSEPRCIASWWGVCPAFFSARYSSFDTPAEHRAPAQKSEPPETETGSSRCFFVSPTTEPRSVIFLARHKLRAPEQPLLATLSRSHAMGPSVG